jgi:hypothetical protein
MLEHLIGKDVSKYFYGGYTLAPSAGDLPYTHSNIARSIVNSLIVARIFEKAPIIYATVSEAQIINRTTTGFIFVPTA